MLEEPVKFSELTDPEIIFNCRKICRNCKTIEKAVGQLESWSGKDVVTSFSVPDTTGERRLMGQIVGPRGNVISF